MPEPVLIPWWHIPIFFAAFVGGSVVLAIPIIAFIDWQVEREMRRLYKK